MTVRDLARASNQVTKADASVCIIGAGIAGLTLAYGLAQKGLDVILLESGDTTVDGEAESFNEIDNVNGRWTGAFRSRCRGLGGTSRRWGGRTIPIALEEARARPYLDSDGWPFALDDLAAYTPQVEKLLRLDGSSYEADLYGDDTAPDPDFRLRWAKWPSFADCNLAVRLNRQVLANPNVMIWTNATVTGFTMKAGSDRLGLVTAGHRSGHSIEVSARHFVFAAGAVESTRLMLWMHRHLGRPGCATSGLGRYFQDHLSLTAARVVRHDAKLSNDLLGYRFHRSIRRSLHLELSPEAQSRNGVGSAFAYVSMDLQSSALGAVKKIARQWQQGGINARELAGLSRHGDVIARSLYWRYFRRRLYVPPSVDFHIEICAEQVPHWDNSITLSDRTDRLGVPLAKVQWAPRAEDERTLRVSVDRLKSFWARSGWDKQASLVVLPAANGSERNLIDSVVDYYHPSGTTRMGENPNSSVVSANLTSHDLPNLSILSTSVFPRAGSANPTFTLMRMALRLADFLGEKRSSVGEY